MLDIVKELLKNENVDINIRDMYGKTALDYAIERGYKETTSLLLNLTNKVESMKDMGW